MFLIFTLDVFYSGRCICSGLYFGKNIPSTRSFCSIIFCSQIEEGQRPFSIYSKIGNMYGYSTWHLHLLSGCLLLTKSSAFIAIPLLIISFVTEVALYVLSFFCLTYKSTKSLLSIGSITSINA